MFINRQGSAATQYAVAGTRYKMTHSDPVCLWLADMDIVPPTCVAQQVSAYLAAPNVGYQQLSITPAVHHWLGRKHQYDAETSEVIDLHSIIGGISVAISALTPDAAKIMVLAPTYPPIIEAIKQNGRQAVEVPYPNFTDALPTDKFVPDASALVLCQPNNPTGQMLNDAQRRELMDYCDKHNILIMSDEAHGDFTFDSSGMSPWSALLPSAADRVIVFASPNKTFNLAAYPGASYAVFENSRLAATFREAIAGTHMDAGGLSKVILNAVYEHADSWLRETRNVISTNRQWASDYLQEHLDGGAGSCGEAGYFCWFNLASLLGVPADKAWTVARDKGVLVADGAGFGQPGYARMTLATSPDIVKKAFDRLT